VPGLLAQAQPGAEHARVLQPHQHPQEHLLFLGGLGRVGLGAAHHQAGV